MWRRGSSFRLLSALMLVIFTLSCTTWKKQELAPEQVVATKKPKHVRVIRPDSTKLELWRPRITQDSLIGTVGRADSTAVSGVALTDIKRLEVEGVSAGKTAGWSSPGNSLPIEHCGQHLDWLQCSSGTPNERPGNQDPVNSRNRIARPITIVPMAKIGSSTPQ